MKTRNQSRRQSGESPVPHDSEAGSSSRGKSKRTRGSVSPAPEESVKPKKPPKRRREVETLVAESENKLSQIDETSRKKLVEEVVEEHARDANLKGCSTVSMQESEMVEGKNRGECSHAESDELDWEEGTVSASEKRLAYSHDLGKDVIIEFTDSSSTKKKPSRRVSSEDKELSELVHKVHLLCLLARGRIVDNACNDPILQASLFSLLPTSLLMIENMQKLTVEDIVSIVNWFSSKFHVQSQSVDKGSFSSNLAFALQSQRGTAEEVAALSVVLFRALDVPTRFVSMLDVSSLKPDNDFTGASNQNTPSMNTKMSSSAVALMKSDQVNIPSIYPVEDIQDSRASQRDLNKKRENAFSNAQNLYEGSGANSVSNNQIGCCDVRMACNDKLGSCVTKLPEGSKSKGDLEFELQLEMAISATAAGIDPKMDEFPSSSSSVTTLKQRKQRKAGESVVSIDGGSGAVWSRKTGPSLYWAEVYCGGEIITGRWVHVDAANGIVDGAEKVEPSAAACRKPLRYVVAFSGNGAKDVTRRYCMHWHKIASRRVSSEWWETVLSPLKELESASTGGIEVLKQESLSCFPGDLSRNCIEDMELATRAFTEPLPTNQQAYKNHHLYALERWLNKNQVLHPKGPILGYCSGNPVYPRSCVQTLQTKHKWLREGLQVRAGEVAAKVVARPKKFAYAENFEKEFHEEDSSEPTVELFGKWQVKLLQLPHAVNGIVPKNERGQVEVWSEKCLPPGTVHLRLPRLVPVARRLGIDFAPAFVGFEFRNGRSLPIFDGIVVCREFKDALLEAYAEEEERREAEEKKRNEAQALSRWYQLLSSIITRRRLKNSYTSTSWQIQEYQNDQRSDEHHPQACSTKSNTETDAQHSVDSSRQPSRVVGSDSSYHEHVFPPENQTFEEETFIRTKLCPCGFSIQVEEL